MSFKGGACVLADDMHEEVFSNMFLNTVNYTEGNNVPIEIGIEESNLKGRNGMFWKISIIDHGKGIPDELKQHAFTRYLNAASGTGLGLSTVYALVVERYSGHVNISNTVQGDYSKGTRIELWLQKAP